VIDVGAGDGHSSLRLARTQPRTLAIALDPATDRLSDGARTALRQKIGNILFVVSSIEGAPCELDGIADQITVSFPWGALLRGIVRAEPGVVRPLARIAKPGADVRALLSVEERDAAVGLDTIDARTIARNAAAYAGMGFTLTRCAIATPAERACGSSWSKRLAPDRHVVAVTLRRDRDVPPRI
jgi:16S rRNA (adenine(1408)-N(1))-methyltransferase